MASLSLEVRIVRALMFTFYVCLFLGDEKGDGLFPIFPLCGMAVAILLGGSGEGYGISESLVL